MATADLDKDFVEYIVKSIVENPTKVKVEKSTDERGVLISLTVDPSDMGKIIGKEGRTAKSIRTLLRVLGAKTNSRINLKVVEPEGSTGPTENKANASEDALVDEATEEATPEVVEEVVEESETTKAAKKAKKEAEEAADLEI